MKGFRVCLNMETLGWFLYLYMRFLPSDMYMTTLNPGESQRVSTGLKIKVPDGYEGQIRSNAYPAETFVVTDTGFLRTPHPNVLQTTNPQREIPPHPSVGSV